MSLRLTRWLLFAAGFCAVHVGFFLFASVRELPLTGGIGVGDVCMGVLGAIFIFFFFGPITCAKFAIGYALVDSIALAGKARPSRWQRYDPVVAGVLGGLSVFAVLALREVVPAMAENIAASYFGGFGLRFFRSLWAPALLGGLCCAFMAAVGIAVGRHRQTND